MSKTPEYRAWADMHDRCRNLKNPFYADYGGRGIYVCRRWQRFENFIADMGRRPPGLTLERRHVNRGYTPTNCRRATRKQQMRNRRCIRKYKFRGESKTLPDWADFLQIPAFVLRSRIVYGWSYADVFGRAYWPKPVLTPTQRKVQKAAGAAVQQAVRRGHLQRPRCCSRCNRAGKIEAHHHKGYLRRDWLLVIWLCVKCHRRVEYDIGEL